MKKILKFAFAIVAMAGVVLSSASCGKDEEKNSNDYLGDKNIPLPIEEDIFYVSEQTTSSITCKWDDIDYDSCVIKIYDAIFDRSNGQTQTYSESGHPFNRYLAVYKYENESVARVTSGTEYKFDNLQEGRKIGLKYSFYKQDIEIKRGVYHTMTIDGTKHMSNGSFDVGDIWHINNKKWISFVIMPQVTYYTCNLEREFLLEDSSIVNVGVMPLLNTVKPFARGYHFATDEDFMELEKKYGMSESDLTEFSKTRGKDIKISEKIMNETEFTTGYYLSYGPNGNFITRGFSFDGSISRELKREFSLNSYVIFVED